MRVITGGRSERGSAIVMVAVSLAALLAVGALAVDLGMMLKVRNDAQRTADAAALAGAAAYLKQKPADAVDSAFNHAFEYAARNYVGGTYVDTSGKSPPIGSPPDVTTNGTHLVRTSNEAVVVVIPDSEKVRVIVRRTTTGTFFGRLFNVYTIPVAAKAAAVAATANASNRCIKPFALPDIWSESPTEDPNQNHLEDVGDTWNNPVENWEYANNAGDYYRAYGDDRATGGPAAYTGWGSSYRNDQLATGSPTKYWDDYGREIKLKVTSPHDTPSPSFFQPWVIPGTGPGASNYRQNIWSCSQAEITLTQDYTDYSTDPELSKPGNMVGPTFQGMDSLIAQDPDACWADIPDPNHTGWTRGEVRKLVGGVGGSCTGAYPGWEGSPRVITVPLFDPAQIQPGRTSLRFNNLGVFFIQAQNQRKDPVTANFLYFAKGTGEPGGGGALIKKLRLVE